MDSNDVKSFYDAYVPRQVAGGVHARHKAIMSAIKRLKCLAPNADILEIGCGIGTVTQLLAKERIKSLHAIDISEASVAAAKERLARYNHVIVEVSDASELRPEAYDLIVLPDVLEHIPESTHPELFKRMEASLRPGGYIFINIPDPDHLDHVRATNPKILQIIDQSIRFPKMCEALEKTNLDVVLLERYSIWTKPFDYRRIVLRKAGPRPVFSKKHSYLVRRLKGAIHRVSQIFP